MGKQTKMDWVRHTGRASSRKKEFPERTRRKTIYENQQTYQLVTAFLIRANCSLQGREVGEKSKGKWKIRNSPADKYLLTGEVFGNFQHSLKKILKKSKIAVFIALQLHPLFSFCIKKLKNKLFSDDFQMVR